MLIKNVLSSELIDFIKSQKYYLISHMVAPTKVFLRIKIAPYSNKTTTYFLKHVLGNAYIYFRQLPFIYNAVFEYFITFKMINGSCVITYSMENANKNG